MQIKLRKGLTIPLAGAPEQIIDDAAVVKSVALLGRDYLGLKPAMAVAQGDRVRLGQTLFHDKRNPEVAFTAPGAGVISAIHRGPRRVLQSIVIELDGHDETTFSPVAPAALHGLTRGAVRERLLASGLWTSLRTRPFSRVPSPDDAPHAIFVPALDTNPLAADPEVVIAARRDDFMHGLTVLARLTDGKVHVCTAPGSKIEAPPSDSIALSQFSGPHPAGLVGTHIHFLEPVGARRTVWHLHYQDVIAIGALFTSGRILTERVVAVAGPKVKRPRLVRTRLGASTKELLQGELERNSVRVVSGSVLSGHRASQWAAFLGRYHLQISVLLEGGEREFLGWAMPGSKKYSAIRAYAGHIFKGPHRLTTLLNGSPRAMVPIGNFETVMPLDILPAPLLKALLVGDTESAQALGCLELDEEDLALCAFVCSGKYEYGPFLRETLNEIEKNG
jgi:Na+-transporting NADH:ubiquinone oxidoreductase subunit A